MRVLTVLAAALVLSADTRADKADSTTQQQASAQFAVLCTAILYNNNGSCPPFGHQLNASAAVNPMAAFNVASVGSFSQTAITCNSQPWTLQELIDSCTPLVNTSYWSNC